jgi:hypothetical protein
MEHDDEIEGEPLDPAKEARKRSIASALSTSGLGYEIVEHDYAKHADRKDISEDEARRQIRHVQCDNGTLVVEVDEEYAALKVPYSSSLLESDVADAVFATLKILRDEAKLVPYDPNLERELDLEADRDAFLDSFRRAVEAARENGAEEQADRGPKAPWYRRLLGRGGRSSR